MESKCTCDRYWDLCAFLVSRVRAWAEWVWAEDGQVFATIDVRRHHAGGHQPIMTAHVFITLFDGQQCGTPRDIEAPTARVVAQGGWGCVASVERVYTQMS